MPWGKFEVVLFVCLSVSIFECLGMILGHSVCAFVSVLTGKCLGLILGRSVCMFVC